MHTTSRQGATRHDDAGEDAAPTTTGEGRHDRVKHSFEMEHLAPEFGGGTFCI